MSTEIRKSQQTGQRGWRNRIKQGCPSLGHRVPTLWASVAQGLSNVSPSLGPSLFCSFLYLVDYIVPYSYCKLTIIFSIPNSTCQSSILFLVSIYILYLSLALPPFYEEWMCLLWRLRAVLYEGWNSIQMTGDEGWIFTLHLQNPSVYRGFRRKDEGWRVNAYTNWKKWLR